MNTETNFDFVSQEFAGKVKADYLTTYRNYYGVGRDDPAYGIILQNNLVNTLCRMLKANDINTADLKRCAHDYLISAGLSERQLEELAEKIAA